MENREQIPPCLYIFACDNILRRRLLQAHNRNAYLCCPSPRHCLLLALTKCSSESGASTRSLLFTKTNLTESNIDISRDLHDDETLCDLDSRLGQEKTPKSHFLDVDALSESLVSCRILFADLKETPDLAGTFRHARQFGSPAGNLPSLRNSFALGPNDPNDPNDLNVPNVPNDPNDPNDPNGPNGPNGPMGGMQHFPRINDHNYKCQFTDPYDQLEAQQKISEGKAIGSFGDQTVQISPSTLRLSLGSPEETLRVLNMIPRDVDFYVLPGSFIQSSSSPFRRCSKCRSPAGLSNRCRTRRSGSSRIVETEIPGRLSLEGRYQGMKSVSLKLVVGGTTHPISVKIVCFDKEGPKIELFNSEGIVNDWDVPSRSVEPEPIRWQTPSGEQFGLYGQPSGEQFGMSGNPSGEYLGAFQPPSGEHFAMYQPSLGEHYGGFSQPSGEHYGGFQPPSGEHYGGFSQPSGEHYGGFSQPSGEHFNPYRPSREHFGRFSQPSYEHFEPSSKPYMHQSPSDEPPQGVTVETRENLRFRDCEELRSQIQIKGNVISIPAGMTQSYVFKIVVYNHSNRKINLDLNPFRSPFSCKYNNIVIEP